MYNVMWCAQGQVGGGQDLYVMTGTGGSRTELV